MQRDFFTDFFATIQPLWLDILTNVVYLAAITAMEPFYVGAGFALYLNRRTLLEGWDIEIAFRRIAERQQAASKISPVVASLLLGLVLSVMLLAPAPSLAAEAAIVSTPPTPAVMPESPEQLKKQISQLLKQPEFQTEKIEKNGNTSAKKHKKNRLSLILTG